MSDKKWLDMATAQGGWVDGCHYSHTILQMISTADARGDKHYVLRAFVGRRVVRTSTSMGGQTLMRITWQRQYDERYAILQDGDTYLMIDMIDDVDIDPKQMTVDVTWANVVTFNDYDAAIAAAVMQGD